MHNESSAEEVYFQTSYRSFSEAEGLNEIELLGIPGELQPNGEYIVNKEITGFFEDLIAKELFRGSRKQTHYQFESLKVWLYDTTLKTELLGDKFPSLTEKTLRIDSPIEQSELICIYVVENDFLMDEYVVWKEACEQLLRPLFHRFVPPPDPPDVLKDFLVMRFGMDLTNKLDLYLSMRKNMFFNALIVQMDNVSLRPSD
ncbi:MAG: hypothetical protein AAFY72_08460 [Cyanobacteria bacterium J06649_4]